MSTVADLSSSASDSRPVASTTGDIRRDIPTQVRNTISTTIHYSTRCVPEAEGTSEVYDSARVVEEVVKPSIKTFLETCDTNPQVAAIVATPALLAFLLVLAFFVISTLILILWSLLTISVGIVFVVLGGLISLLFKLFIVFIATIPLAGVATGLLVCTNAASQFIIRKLPAEGMGSGITQAVKEADWKKIMDGVSTSSQHIAQWVRDAMPILLMVRDALSTLGLALHSALQTAMTALHQSAETANTSQVAQTREFLVEEPVAETAQPTLASIGLGDEIPEKIEPVNISDLSSQSESPARVLKQRIPFTDVGDTETE